MSLGYRFEIPDTPPSRAWITRLEVNNMISASSANAQKMQMYKCTNEECRKFDIAVPVQDAGDKGYLCVWCVKPMRLVKSVLASPVRKTTGRGGKRRP